MKLTAKPVRFMSSSYKQAKTLLKTVFPKNEQTAAFPLVLGTLNKNIHFTAFYDEDAFVGILYTIENDKTFFTLYLAVNPQIQSKGYGGMLLDYAYSQAGERNIILNVEPLDSKAPNYEQRKRRLAFYQKHGICPTGYRFTSDGVSYAVLSSNPKNFDPKECKKIFGGVKLRKEKEF